MNPGIPTKALVASSETRYYGSGRRRAWRSDPCAKKIMPKSLTNPHHQNNVSGSLLTGMR